MPTSTPKVPEYFPNPMEQLQVIQSKFDLFVEKWNERMRKLEEDVEKVNDILQ